MLRDARMEDIKEIYSMLQHFAAKDLLLGRSLSSLYDQLRDFKVFVETAANTEEEKDTGSNASDSRQRIVGVCSLHICWENLAEIRSLAVMEPHQGRGAGTALVKASLAEAVTFGISRVFTLTYQPEFFKKLGFRDIDKGELPHKVWSDCIHCPKFPDCHEVALIWEKEKG